jgi:hypothetical protein
MNLHSFEDFVLMTRHGMETIMRSCHLDRNAMVHQMPGRHEAAPTVAARSGQHNDRLGGETLHCQAGERSTGVLHHLQQFDSEILDHHAIDLGHLGSRHSRNLSRVAHKHVFLFFNMV